MIQRYGKGFGKCKGLEEKIVGAPVPAALAAGCVHVTEHVTVYVAVCFTVYATFVWRDPSTLRNTSRYMSRNTLQCTLLFVIWRDPSTLRNTLRLCHGALYGVRYFCYPGRDPSTLPNPSRYMSRNTLRCTLLLLSWPGSVHATEPVTVYVTEHSTVYATFVILAGIRPRYRIRHGICHGIINYLWFSG